MKILQKTVIRPYDIVLNSSFEGLKEQILTVNTPSSICIITDSHIAPLYLEQIKAIADQIAPTYAHVFEAGEESKNITTVTAIYDTLLAHNMDRSSLIIALGGGVTGDIAGFVAATYMRGVPFVQLPMTIVAQNDSSIGGKVGIDYLNHKNMVGAFNNPSLVYINTTVLKTLPQRELVGGLAEVIKHGVIEDIELFRYLMSNRKQILELDDAAILEMTYKSCKVKCDIVEQDPKEKGIRKILNFGHTIGHAIETLSQFKYNHGECVAYGMCGAAFISYKRQLLTLERVNEIVTLCRSFGLLKPLGDYRAQDIWQHMAYDKKKAHGKIAFILLKAVGTTSIVTDISEDEVAQAITFIKETCL
jgi:3-dehydroquinate synthase